MTGVAMYNVFGRQVGAHWLSMATLGTAFAIPFMMSGGKKEAPGAKNTPPINASSKEEESFITDFIKDMEKEDKKA